MFYHLCQIEDSSCLNELWPKIAAFLDLVHIWLLLCITVSLSLLICICRCDGELCSQTVFSVSVPEPMQ